MTSNLNTTFTIGAWNIDSLFTRIANVRTCKFNIPQISSKLNKYDIFCISETHCSPSDKIDFEGYHLVQNFRPKSERAPRAFGGLLVGVKLSLVKGISFLKQRHSEFMWFKLGKSFFWLQSDLYVYSLYISPAGYSFSFQRDDIFTLIEEDIAKYSALGDYMLVDFNARTSNVADFIEHDSIHDNDIVVDYVVDKCLHRNNLNNHCTVCPRKSGYERMCQ